MRLERRRLHLVLGTVALVAAVGALAWWKLAGPPKLGLDTPRVVLAAGAAGVDGLHVRAGKALAQGASLLTERGSMCFSVHASRVCVGTATVAQLTAVGDASATVNVSRGTLIAASERDVLTIVMPGATLRVAAATAAIEGIGSPHATLRVLDGNVTLQASGRADAVVTAPASVEVADGSNGRPSPELEGEERSVAQLAREWQGTAGAVVDIENMHGRVELDGAYVGLPPATVLVSEGNHTLVVRDTGNEITHETLKLTAGQTLVRGS